MNQAICTKGQVVETILRLLSILAVAIFLWSPACDALVDGIYEFAIEAVFLIDAIQT